MPDACLVMATLAGRRPWRDGDPGGLSHAHTLRFMTAWIEVPLFVLLVAAIVWGGWALLGAVANAFGMTRMQFLFAWAVISKL